MLKNGPIKSWAFIQLFLIGGGKKLGEYVDVDHINEHLGTSVLDNKIIYGIHNEMHTPINMKTVKENDTEMRL